MKPPEFSALIVDDEIHNRIVLEKMLQQHIPGVATIYQAGTVQESMDLIEQHKPQLVFLDIQMQGETGFDLLQQIPQPCFEVIFVTAYDQFAIKAFRFNAVDYLLKPIVLQELKAAVSKAFQKLDPNHGNINRMREQWYNGKKFSESITIPTAEGFSVMPLEDIIYCQASSNYTIIHAKGEKKIVSSQTLGYYEELLAEHNFFRAHRSYLINLAQVSSFKKGEGGFIIMRNGDEVELARNNKNEFMQLFKG